MKILITILTMLFSSLIFGQKANNMMDPPSYIESLCKQTDQKTKDKIEKEYGDYITVFSIKNFCSELKMSVDGGLLIGYDSKGESKKLFDSGKNGYNGMFEIYPSDSEDSLQSITTSAVELIVTFQYGGEEKEYSEQNGGQPQDYFDWIVFYKKVNGKLEKIFESECA